MTGKSITRRKVGKSYRYYLEGEQLTDKNQIEFIDSLRIPPAWRDVQIAPNKQAKILVTGTDRAGRTQYIYNPAFRARQEEEKFERVLRFARALPHMRRVVDEDLRRRRLDFRKVMATIISIMDRTYIRVGNEQYTKENGSYGLTTMRSKHTTVDGATVTFDFIGKSGKHQVRRITDRTLARIVRQLDDLPGYEVFKYYDDDGALRDVSSADVNAYIKEVMGEEFSAKDFRTWAGTLIASAELALAERAASEREREKAVTACVRKVAKKLGNTPAIARASYIDPRIIKTFMDGEDLARIHKTVEAMESKKGSEYLSPDERCVLEVLDKAA